MLGKVSVTPAEVIGGDTVNLVIEYTSTDIIAREAEDATTADDGMSSHGRIRVALPTGWGPASSLPDNPAVIPELFNDGYLPNVPQICRMCRRRVRRG